MLKSLFFIKSQAGSLQLCQKKTKAQMLSSEFYEVFKNTYFAKHLRAAASNHSGYFKKSKDKQIIKNFKHFTSEAVPHKISSENPIQVFI